jgi:hypothetical protein
LHRRQLGEIVAGAAWLYGQFDITGNTGERRIKRGIARVCRKRRYASRQCCQSQSHRHGGEDQHQQADGMGNWIAVRHAATSPQGRGSVTVVQGAARGTRRVMLAVSRSGLF